MHALSKTVPKFPEDWIKPSKPGYGTFPWPFADSTDNYQSVARTAQSFIEEALRIGYRHIDTAFTYRNQDLIGNSVKKVGIPRKDLFVTSKLHQNNNNYNDAQHKIKEAIRLIWGQAVKPSEAYLDAFLIHYPGVGQPLEAWKALQEARVKDEVKHIGVSNFEIWHLEKIYTGSGEYPEINQIEFHPWIYHEQADLVDFCRTRGITIEGYSPLAQKMALQDPVVGRIAVSHKSDPARILLKWSMQHGVKPIVGSRNAEHLRANVASYDFRISDEQMLELDRLGGHKPIRIAEKWDWNSKTAPFGEPVPARFGKPSVRRLWSKLFRF